MPITHSLAFGRKSSCVQTVACSMLTERNRIHNYFKAVPHGTRLLVNGDLQGWDRG